MISVSFFYNLIFSKFYKIGFVWSDSEPYYDINEDGKIDILDIVIVATNYGKAY
jgi:hypothetical protein